MKKNQSIYFFDGESLLTALILRMASACVIGLPARLKISSHVISRMVLPVITFLAAPESFEFVSIR